MSRPKRYEFENGTQAWFFEGKWWVRASQITSLDEAPVGGQVTNSEMFPTPMRWKAGAKPPLRPDTRHWIMREVRP